MAFDYHHPQNKKNTDRYRKPDIIPTYSRDFEISETSEPVIKHDAFPIDSYKKLFSVYKKCCDDAFIMTETIGEGELNDDGSYDLDVISIYCMNCGYTLVCADDLPNES